MGILGSVLGIVVLLVIAVWTLKYVMSSSALVHVLIQK
jgi:hypothetical protein